MKGRIITLLIFLALLLTIFILGSCKGPDKAARKLSRAQRLMNEAIAAGAKVQRDTTWQMLPVVFPEIKFSTTIRPNWQIHSLSKDTLRHTDKKTGAEIKAKVDLKKDCPEDCIERIYFEGKCPEQKKEVKAAATIGNTIKAGYTRWEMIILAIAALAVGAVLGRLFWK